MQRVVWLCGLLAACSAGDPAIEGRDAGGGEGRDATQPDAPEPSESRDYRQGGPASVDSEKKTFKAAACDFEYETFTPDAKTSEVVLVIAPGFALADGLGSSREALTPLAEHLTSWGIVTHTVKLCTNGASIDHAKNGAAIAELGKALGGARVVYAGFSAGGLGAMIAASQATNTLAYLALDAVDKDDLARAALDALDAIDAPTYALIGEPSSCNSDGNMRAQYEGSKTRVVKVNGAQHFIFEGSACQGIKCALCNGGDDAEATAVRALTSAFVLGVAGVDAGALRWWQTDSAEWKLLADQGLISNIQ